jgi:hypothetical protein
VSASGRNVSDRPGSGADPSDGEKSPRGDCAAAGTIPCFCFFSSCELTDDFGFE